MSQHLQRLRDALAQQPRYLLVLRLTCLFLLLNGFVTEGSTTINLPVQILCLFMLLTDAFLMVTTCWLLLALVMTVLLVPNWCVYDNHKFLMIYWVAACALATRHTDQEECLSTNARLLVGWVFVWATLWKVVNGEYLDGTFFHFQFLADSRFLNLAVVAGGMDAADVKYNQQNLEWMKLFPGSTISAVLQTSFRLRALAYVACYATLVIEAAVATSFLRLGPRWFTRHKDQYLLAFLLVTLLTVPVHGFASILAILGLAQVRPDRQGLRLAYLAVFFYVQIAILLPNWLNVFSI